MYLNTNTLERATERDIRASFSNTSFPEPFVAPAPYAVLFAAPQPSYDPITQSVRETTPELTTLGHWEQRWEVVDLDAETIAANTAAAYEASVPKSVTMRQARLALAMAGKLALIEAAMDQIPDETQKQVAKIEWEYATEIKRDWPLVISLQPLLGMTDEDIDNLFIFANTL